jgi:hypothetical protein
VGGDAAEHEQRTKALQGSSQMRRLARKTRSSCSLRAKPPGNWRCNSATSLGFRNQCRFRFTDNTAAARFVVIADERIDGLQYENRPELDCLYGRDPSACHLARCQVRRVFAAVWVFVGRGSVTARCLALR